jgi:protein TonB
MSVASSSLVTPARSKALMVRLAPNLVEAVCELTRAARDKTHAQTEISGLLYGRAEEGVVTVEALKTFKDSGPRSELARRERMEKSYEAASAQAKADPEFSSYKLLGWFSLRGSGGLINSDVEFHNRHFKDADDVALIVWREGDSQITAELYATADTKLTSEDYRWSSVRLSTELRRVSQPIDLVMRLRVNDDLYIRTYASVEKQERNEEWKKITAAAKRTIVSWLPGRSHAVLEEQALPLLKPPKPATADGGSKSRSFESRTLFRDTPPVPAARTAPVAASTIARPPEPTKTVAPYDANRATGRPPTPEITGLPMVIQRKAPVKGIPWLSLALVAILCSGLTFAVYALNGIGTGSSKLSQVMRVLFPGTDLELRAEGSGDRLLLTWNRKNPVVASAANAVLSITDGAEHFDRKLDPVQVANGSVLYRPISGDVTFKLTVVGSDQAIAMGSLRVLDATAAPAISQTQTKPVDDKPALDMSNVPAAQQALPPPPAVNTDNPLAAAVPAIENHLVNKANLPAVAAAKPQKSEAQALTNLKTAAPKPQQTTLPSPPAQTAASPKQNSGQPPASPVSQSVSPTPKPLSRPSNAPPVTSNTAINGWDPNLPDTKLSAPQQAEPQQATPPDGKTVAAFVPPKVLLQVMPNIRSIPSNLVSDVTRVEVEVKIDTNGRVSAAHVETPNVKSQLVSAALAAARQWTFQPATLRGQRVETTHTISFEFRPGGQ